MKNIFLERALKCLMNKCLTGIINDSFSLPFPAEGTVLITYASVKYDNAGDLWLKWSDANLVKLHCFFIFRIILYDFTKVKNFVRLKSFIKAFVYF